MNQPEFSLDCQEKLPGFGELRGDFKRMVNQRKPEKQDAIPGGVTR